MPQRSGMKWHTPQANASFNTALHYAYDTIFMFMALVPNCTILTIVAFERQDASMVPI
jgi:hypothetical protein